VCVIIIMTNAVVIIVLYILVMLCVYCQSHYLCIAESRGRGLSNVTLGTRIQSTIMFKYVDRLSKSTAVRG
jgi:hypothetical protein